MRDYFVKRILFTLATVMLMSIAIFGIIQAPPGDAVDRIVAQMRSEGDDITPEAVENLKRMYGLDRPMTAQYWDWLTGLLTGEMGLSVTGQPVAGLIKQRLPQTITLALVSLLVTYIIAIPIGIYSATHQYSVGDYVATTFGFIGLATPNFLFGLILLYLFFKWFGLSIGGFSSPEFEGAAWSLAKLFDFAKHMVIPVIVIASASTAGTIRSLRATLLDELGKEYVLAARAKGVPWRRLLFRYPVRLAIIPIVAGIGYVFPFLLAGQTIVAIVLNLQTLGPLMFSALKGQDVQLGGSVLMIQSLLAIFGVLVSDLLLMVVDPRIRIEKGAQ